MSVTFYPWSLFKAPKVQGVGQNGQLKGLPISPLVSKHQTLGQESQLLNFLIICTNTVLLIDVAAKICVGLRGLLDIFPFGDFNKIYHAYWVTQDSSDLATHFFLGPL